MRTDEKWIVYILHCNDGDIYVGCTQNMRERLRRHNRGDVPATIGKRPVTLLSYTVFRDKTAAFRFEKYLKSGSGRAFIIRHLSAE